MTVESWFRSLWRPSWKHEAHLEKAVVGVLAFEVASLMSRLVHLWQSLSDKQVDKLMNQIMNSVGVRNLVSEDDDLIVELVCAEMIENLENVVRSVTRLANKCNEPTLNSFGHVFDDLVKLGTDPYGWEFSSKKMERKVKKMEWFICINTTVYQEMEMLSELEQSLRRFKSHNVDPSCIDFLEYQKRFVCKQQEVKNLQDISLWNKTHDYTIHLLARSIYTIFRRIKDVFGINQVEDTGEMENLRTANSDFIYHSQSLYALMLSADDHSDRNVNAFSPGLLQRSSSKSTPISRTDKTSHHHLCQFGSLIVKSGPIHSAHKSFNIYSRMAKSGPISGKDKSSRMLWQLQGNSSTFFGNKPNLKANRVAQVQPCKGCRMDGCCHSISNSRMCPNGVHLEIIDGPKGTKHDLLAHGTLPHNNLSLFICKRRLLNAPPGTLGAAALGQHYANVIILIEKLVASPHLIGQDARDDLYCMLPASVRAALRVRLKRCTTNLGASVCGTVIAAEFSEAMAGILEWLSPLAHNMIRWHAERSFEQQNSTGPNVLLVQTLYFANQEKTEAAITELLVGLNYVWRFGRDLNAKSLVESVSSSMLDDYLDLTG